MSIGEDLAEARRRAGLSVTEVSQRTRIREAIVRGIERDDYAGCGGDFYARGFIRAIARVVGADSGPLIRDYDAAHRAPQAVPTAELLGPVAPLRLRERRRLNWTAVLALALVIALGLAAYLLISAPGQVTTAPGHAHRASLHRRPSAAPSAPAAAPAQARYAHEVVVKLTATQDCWVEFTTPAGGYQSQSYVVAGMSKSWIFRRAVDMRLGNPGGIELLVDGKNPLPAGVNRPITLSLRLHGNPG